MFCNSLLVVLAFIFCVSAFDAPLITLPYVTLSGAYSDYYNITHYRQIPYGAPTSGVNRFRAPQPPAQINGTYDTNQTFSPCPQQDGTGSEDCLYLGVYSRPWVNGTDLRPVVVVFHGGAYVAGSGRLTFPPSGFATLNVSTANDFVMVYTNYRLGAFGFLPGSAIKATADAALNPGLLDQQAALTWVQNNIALFGGDPANVTIFGQSAGGGSVIAQLIANGGRTTPKLFQRALPSSPYWVKTYQYNDPEAENLYSQFVNSTGCTGASNVLACMRNLDFNSTLAASNKVGQQWAPVIDGAFLQSTLSQAVGNQTVNANFVWGMFNTHEGESFLDSSLRNPSGSPYNSTEQGFDGWLAAFLPRFSAAQLQSVKDLYPSAGQTDTSNWNTTWERAGYVYRDSVISCPAYWLASRAQGAGWLEEYTNAPALHVSFPR